MVDFLVNDHVSVQKVIHFGLWKDLVLRMQMGLVIHHLLLSWGVSLSYMHVRVGWDWKIEEMAARHWAGIVIWVMFLGGYCTDDMPQW